MNNNPSIVVEKYIETEEKRRVVLIIPYFGKKPDYFDLWLLSAERNPQFTFYIYTDIPLPVKEGSNVVVKYTTFTDLKNRLREKVGRHCVIENPYKLTDYKAAYGKIFEDDIAEFEFWGFADIDVILGNLSRFVTDEFLDNHDKMFHLGHFCIMRNNPKMKQLYQNKYPNVIDFDYISRTNYPCHFDENGTIAYAPEFEKDIRYYSEWLFYDVPFMHYKMLHRDSEVYVIWDNGTLMYHNPKANKHYEIMYIHLQKRKMSGMEKIKGTKFAIMRTQFCDASIFDTKTCEDIPVDSEEEKIFQQRYSHNRKKNILKKLRQGALKFRINRKIYKWREQ